MPRATANYEFEFRLITWAGEFVTHITGEHRSFAIILDDNGVVTMIHFAEKAHTALSNAITLQDSHPNWFYYNTFDAPEYLNLSWQNFPQSTFERLLKQPFAVEDFSPRKGDKQLEGFPTTWYITI